MRGIWAIPVMFGILLLGGLSSSQTVYGPHFTTLDNLDYNFQGTGTFASIDVFFEVDKPLTKDKKNKTFEICVDWGTATDSRSSVPIEIVALDLVSCEPFTVVGETSKKNVLLATTTFQIEPIDAPSGVADITGTYEIVNHKGKSETGPTPIDARDVIIGGFDSGSGDPRADSFFDVFFDVELYTVDSFFDIFTELQSSTARSDSFFDVFFDVELYTVDSFFDIFTELQTDVDTIETEMVAMNLRSVDPVTEELPDSFFDVFVELDALDAEEQARANADQALADALNDEIAAREAADQALADALAQEVAAREAADTPLQQKTTDNMMGVMDNADTIGTIQTEILSMDLRGTSCPPGQVMEGVEDRTGRLLCIPLGSGGGSGLSCDNQRAIANAVPGFVPDANCIPPLTIELFDFDVNARTLTGGIIVCQATLIPSNVDGGVAPYSYLWQMTDTSAGIATINIPTNSLGSFTWNQLRSGDFPATATLSLTITDFTGTTVTDSALVTCNAP